MWNCSTHTARLAEGHVVHGRHNGRKLALRPLHHGLEATDLRQEHVPVHARFSGQHAQQTGNSGHHVARTAHRQQWAPCSTHRSASVRWMRCRAESISASISRVWRSHSTCTRDRFDSAAAVRDSASCNDAFSAAISVSCADTKHNTRRDAKRDTDVKGVRMEKPVHWLAGMANN